MQVDVSTHPAKVQNDPATGRKAAISPKDNIVTNTIAPTMAYDMSNDAGPPFDSAFPVERNNPVPMVPPIAIIWTCLAESLRAS